MSAKPGRNDPCPCGSGRKFKHCCGAAQNTVESPEALMWRRIRRLLGESNAEVQRFAMSAYGSGALDEAWDEFTSPAPDEPAPGAQSPHFEVFMSWFHNFWSPDPSGESMVRDEALIGVEPVRAYLALRGARLDPLLREYLESCLDAPLSFHRVEDVERGVGLVLKDLVTGRERRVAERGVSETAQGGDILFAQVVQAGGLSLIECCAPFAFPPISQIRIAGECRALVGRRKRATFPLREYDLEMLAIYHAAAEPLLNPRLPTLQNTDGEPMSMRKVVFDIDSPERAFSALRHLDPGEDADLARAQRRDAQGRLVEAELSWVEPSRNPRGAMKDKVVAFLAIGPSRLTAEVNSEARERRLRETVERALGAGARYRATEIQSVEQLLARGEASPPSPSRRESDAIADSPEVRALINEHMSRHYDSWVNERIPALGNRTPLQAVKSRAGREAVQALVTQLERDGAKMSPPLDPAIVKRLKERLGLS
jgi:hypothetical protein